MARTTARALHGASLEHVTGSTHDENTCIDSDEMISRLNQEFFNQNDFPFTDCSYRNVLLVGRTRTGKSTIPHVIRDPFYIPPMASLFAATRIISFNSFITNHRGNCYYFTLIDLPGLYDAVVNEGERLENTTIKKYLDECITKDVTHIHAFAFVFSSSGNGINNEDIQSMIFIKKHYPDLQNFFMLIITHCEEKNAEERQAFINEFFQHPEVVRHRLLEFFHLGVHFTGCLRPQLQRNPNIAAARHQAINILDMRRELLNFLVERQETYNIHRQGPLNHPRNYLRWATVGIISLFGLYCCFRK